MYVMDHNLDGCIPSMPSCVLPFPEFQHINNGIALQIFCIFCFTSEPPFLYHQIQLKTIPSDTCIPGKIPPNSLGCWCSKNDILHFFMQSSFIGLALCCQPYTHPFKIVLSYYSTLPSFPEKEINFERQPFHPQQLFLLLFVTPSSYRIPSYFD